MVEIWSISLFQVILPSKKYICVCVISYALWQLFYVYIDYLLFVLLYSTGESAGGNLAAAITARNYDIDYVSLEDRIPIKGLLLIYPPLSCQFDTESYQLYSHYNPTLTKSKMIKGWKLYQDGNNINYNTTTLTDPISNYTFQPLLTPSSILSEFPNTIFILAKYDVLRDDSLLFANRLQSLHVPVDITIYNGTIHGFFGRFSSIAVSAIYRAGEKLVEISPLNHMPYSVRPQSIMDPRRPEDTTLTSIPMIVTSSGNTIIQPEDSLH